MLVEWVLSKHVPVKNFDLETLMEVDLWARRESRAYKLAR